MPALQEAGIDAVIAESYARIFYRNAVDGGFLAPFETRERLIDVIHTGDVIEIDTATGTVKHERTGQEHLLNPLGEVADILEAGNLFAYARANGMIG